MLLAYCCGYQLQTGGTGDLPGGGHQYEFMDNWKDKGEDYRKSKMKLVSETILRETKNLSLTDILARYNLAPTEIENFNSYFKNASDDVLNLLNKENSPLFNAWHNALKNNVELPPICAN